MSSDHAIFEISADHLHDGDWVQGAGSRRRKFKMLPALRRRGKNFRFSSDCNRLPDGEQPRSPNRLRSFIMASRRTRPAAYVYGAGVLLSLWAWAAAPAVAQSGACVLSPDKRNANERILRCGSELTITPAPGTVYRAAAAAGDDGLPASVQLDSGALLIEFNSKRRREFQILTPQAIASVRGTKWAMEVKPGETSTLVLAGKVTVARKNDPEKVVVGPGQGVDVSSLGTPRSMYGKPEPISVKQWAPGRVKELLGRFAQ
jgi:ferric-dicitrate binding protein FerR (iron transport regulator)